MPHDRSFVFPLFPQNAYFLHVHFCHSGPVLHSHHVLSRYSGPVLHSPHMHSRDSGPGFGNQFIFGYEVEVELSIQLKNGNEVEYE